MSILQSIIKLPSLRLLRHKATAVAALPTGVCLSASVRQRVPCWPQAQHPRCIWGYVAVAFNRVDSDRLVMVGPDRLCAEWVLKNGGAVSFVGMGNRVMRDYNTLPPESVKVRVQIVDASNASIMKIGFQHFQNCKFIDTLVLHNCKHLEEDGLEGLAYLAQSLKRLQISGCYNLKQKSFSPVYSLTVLEELRLFDLMYVDDMQALVRDIQKALPKCRISLK